MTTVGVADLVQTWIDYYRPMVATMTDEHLAETIRANQDLLRVALRRRAEILDGKHARELHAIQAREARLTGKIHAADEERTRRSSGRRTQTS